MKTIVSDQLTARELLKLTGDFKVKDMQSDPIYQTVIDLLEAAEPDQIFTVKDALDQWAFQYTLNYSPKIKAQ